VWIRRAVLVVVVLAAKRGYKRRVVGVGGFEPVAAVLGWSGRRAG